jgi:hypothetical protein
MTVRITSLVASGPITLPLLSGATVWLTPGEVSDDLPDVEVSGNAKVAALAERGLIAVETIRATRPKSPSGSKAKSHED